MRQMTVEFEDRKKAAVVLGILQNGGAVIEPEEPEEIQAFTEHDEFGPGLTYRIGLPLVFTTSQGSAVFRSFVSYPRGWGATISVGN